MIGFIGAMDVEVNGIISQIENKTMTKISGINYYNGTLWGKDVVVAKCGVGKVNAAICAQTMILKYRPDVIINTGVAGSLSSELNICDVAVATDVVQHDMDTSPLGDPVGLISGINLVKIPCDIKIAQQLYNCASELNDGSCKLGTIASGDQFLNSDA
ncbi:MAG: 5'-methylthioadenosine/S-adenosylhomocysteine nucleosidase, partial [Clostridia bacterium]|nr:5'-methylthioadenosine/S-adenosylhomocysteine nucleosidase [Clostridia bacterium]